MDQDRLILRDYRFGEIQYARDGRQPVVKVLHAPVYQARSPYQYHDPLDPYRDPSTIKPPSAPIQYAPITLTPYPYQHITQGNSQPRAMPMPTAPVTVAPVLYQPINYPSY
nr:uncharacterized protein LOC128695020 [Cherax quadricarinatus]